MLGLGYPGRAGAGAARRGRRSGGVLVPGIAAERARGGRGARRKAFADSLDFSFAGVKTALLYAIRELGEDAARERAADLAASYQAAIVEALARARRAGARAHGARSAWRVGGGVAANGALRRAPAASWASTLHVPARSLCTDNAAMIASAARFARAAAPTRDYLALDAYATGERPP